MSFFDKLFGGTPKEEQAQPNISFGRYTDAYKTAEQNEHWERALSAFGKEEYAAAFESFMEYIKDPHSENVTWKTEKGVLLFSCFQGSKHIVGYADHKIFKVEAKIAKATELHIGFLRRLMELNFEMTYARYALDPEHHLTIVFDSSILDASPYKLYYAMKELALHADRQDDLLVDEFQVLEHVNTSHVFELPETERSEKLLYLRSSIQGVFGLIDTARLNAETYPGGIAYLLLDLVYRLDYLLQPEGKLTEHLEKCHQIFFAKDERNDTIHKNLLMRKELQAILDRSDDQLRKSFHQSVHTFGVVTPVNHTQLVQFIEAEIDNMNWYRDNKYDEVALAVPGYIVGYCLFNYAVPEPDKDLLHLYYAILEPAYFKALGYTYSFYQQNGALNAKEVEKEIQHIFQRHKVKYGQVQPKLDLLRFNNPVEFARSYLLMLKSFNLEPIS